MISVTGSGEKMLKERFPAPGEQIVRVAYSPACG